MANNDAVKTKSVYIPTETELKDAKACDKAVRDGLKAISTGFLDAASYVYKMCLRDGNNQPLYRALGHAKQQDYADALNTSYTEIKALDRVGRMLNYGVEGKYWNGVNWQLCANDTELIACGKASMIELARLAGSAEEYNQNIGDIVRLINARSNGSMTHKELKAELDAMLKKEPKVITSPVPTNEDTDGERVDMSGDFPAWKRALLKALGTAHTPAEALIVAQSIVADYGDTGEVISITTASAAA